MDPSLGGKVTQGGRTTAAVDGVGDAQVCGGSECHGLDVGEGVVVELELSLEQVLRAHDELVFLDMLHGIPC